MTERDYERMLDAVQETMGSRHAIAVRTDPGHAPAAANDNAVEWSLTPFPEGWHASP